MVRVRPCQGGIPEILHRGGTDVHGKDPSDAIDGQTVLLPREFRFPVGVEEVAIHRQGDQIILEPLEREEWPEDFWKAFGGLSPDFERPR